MDSPSAPDERARPPDLIDLPVSSPEPADGPAEAPEVVEPWSPRSFPGLAFWLDASVGVTTDADGRVEHWADRSGKNNYAFQSVAAYRPLRDGGGAGGRPSIHFPDGGTDLFLRMTDNKSLQWGLKEFTVVTVARSTNREFALFIRKQDRFAPWTGWQLGINFEGEGRARAQLRFLDISLPSEARDLTDGKIRVFTARRSSPETLEIRVNGRGTPITVPTLDVSMAGFDVFIGGHGEEMRMQLHGNILELVGIAGPLPDSDLAVLEEYLKQKHDVR